MIVFSAKSTLIGISLELAWWEWEGVVCVWEGGGVL